MPINRKLQNIIGTEHITDAAETAIAAQASGGATVAFKNVAVAGQDNIVADAATDTLTVAAGSNVTVTTTAGTDTLTIAAADTQLSTEAVQDIVGAMFTGNTETNITATYEDSDGTIDLVASSGGSYEQFYDISGHLSSRKYLFPSSLPPFNFHQQSFGTLTISDDLAFSPVLFLNAVTVSEIGVATGGATNELEIAIYSSDSNLIPSTRLHAAATITPSGSGVHTAAIPGGNITLAANTRYYIGITNTGNGSNSVVRSYSGGGTTGKVSSSLNRQSLQIFTGTVNSLPATITTGDVNELYLCAMACFVEA